MPLNPFAREYVPNIEKQTSLLNVSSSPAAPGTSQVTTPPALAQAKRNTQPVGSARCPTPAAEAFEDEELQFEDVFEVEAVPSPPSPRSHLSAASPGGLSTVCTSSFPFATRGLLVEFRLFGPYKRSDFCWKAKMLSLFVPRVLPNPVGVSIFFTKFRTIFPTALSFTPM